MEGKVETFLHFFVMFILSAIFYNIVVRQFTPTPVQSWITI